MKTFKEFIQSRGWKFEEEISDKAADVGNKLAQKNPKILPGLTPVPLIKQAIIKDPGVEDLVQKNPTAAGDVASYLGGSYAKKQLGIKN